MTSIPQNFINDLLARVDIVEVINPRVSLRKAGHNYLALCPFHNEKTPSFSVNPRKQFYHCFGCGASGNAISFLMDFEKLDFVDAIESLAALVGVEVPKIASTTQQTQFTQLYALLEKVNNFYRTQLSKAANAQKYLQQRGVSAKICHNFAIGYAPASWNYLEQFYSRHNTVIQKQLLSTGMLSFNQEKNISYAKFRNRITFPIRNRRGNIVGFGARTLGEEIPKYLNSPETILFHKGDELYGLYEARQNNRNLTQIIVVEGYMDVVALAQYDITNAVATLGTAISTKQIQQLLRITPSLFFCFDGDAAGKAAAWRALENSLPLLRDGVELKFLFLPETEDPDSMVRQEGKSAFLHRLENAMPLSDFLFTQLTKNSNIDTIEGRAKLVDATKQILSKMANGVFKKMLLDKLSTLTNIDINSILQNNEKTRSLPSLSTSPNANSNKNSNILVNPFQTAIGLLLNYPELTTTIDDKTCDIVSKLNTAESTLLTQLISLLKTKLGTKQAINLGTIFEYWRNQPNFDLISKIATWEPLIPHADLKKEFTATMQSLQNQGLEQNINTLLQIAKTRELTENEKLALQNLIKIVKKSGL